MRTSSILSKTGLAAGAALAASVALTVSPASAAGSWTVTGGGQFTGKMTNLTLADNATGAKFGCATAAATGIAANGSSLSGERIAAITGKTWEGCVGPAGISFSLSAVTLPWTVNAVSYAKGVTVGTLNGVRTRMEGGDCSADFGGATAGSPATLDVSYNNATHVLSVLGTGNSHAYNVADACQGLLKTGDSVSHRGDLVLSPGSLQIIAR